MPSEYAKSLGARLRSIRQQQGLSLQGVEEKSNGRWKAVVVGSYERGDRAVTVSRLAELADFYRVPVDQLLPRDGEVPSDPPPAGVEPTDVRATVPTWPSKVTFDLARFQDLDGDPELEMVYRYLNSIQVRRQDFNGRVLTIRSDDIRAMAGLFGTDADALLRRLDDLQLRLQPA